ncbi:MAG: hypothetical protein CMD02_00930 [Flavobacteriales bacterium]|nr:hypothetical protein [Flavobacteriales bacterium]|tara:strand:- start:678 stop:1256 length:579 start_codon:yes stop_codon:yes gene_type:complete
MENIKFNTRIRICFESVPDDLGDDLCLVTGALIIIQKPNSPWAYAYHLKSQGGGTFGEYNIVCKAEYDHENEWATWDLYVGDSRVFDPSSAGSIEEINEVETQEMFSKLDDLWNNILFWGGDLVYTSEEVEEYSGYDEMFLCYKSKLSNLVEDNYSYWYSNDNVDWNEELYLGHLDIEYVSGEIPGNMMFID